MHRRFASYSFILGITCLLSACGFQLRGTGEGGTNVPEAWKSCLLYTSDAADE